jgi:hypothetical protein
MGHIMLCMFWCLVLHHVYSGNGWSEPATSVLHCRGTSECGVAGDLPLVMMVIGG